MIIEILGNPIPLKRHRTFVRNGSAIHYDSQQKEKSSFQKEIALRAGSRCLSVEEIEKHEVTIVFGLPYPKTKKKKNMPCLSDIPHTTKPDLDNLVKFVLDCGNGLLWSDDKKIVKITAKKMYVEEPRTIISIE